MQESGPVISERKNTGERFEQSFIDHVLSYSIAGWCAIDGRGQQELSIYRNRRLVATITADGERPDLPPLGIDLRSGFHHRFDPALQEGDEISVMLSDSRRHLIGSPKIYQDRPFGNLPGLDSLVMRSYIAAYVLHGSGIEIGALHRPLSIPSNVRVRYVDRQPRSELAQHYPELAHLPLVDPDIIDDGETLGSLPESSQDFIIASHFIEHCQDPIGTIKAYHRVLRQGGIVFLVVPDRDAFFDRKRPLTSIDHLLQDHELGPQFSRKAHYVEYAELVNNRTGQETFTHAFDLEASNYSIHFHVWTAETFLEMMAAVTRRYNLPLRLVIAVKHQGELIVVYRKE